MEFRGLYPKYPGPAQVQVLLESGPTREYPGSPPALPADFFSIEILPQLRAR